MRHSYIQNSELAVHICEWGDRDKPAVVCLHGLGSTNLSFIEVADRLEDEFYLVSMDLPGHGKTPAFNSEADFEIPNLVSWLDGIIETLKLGRFYFLAHSWGGDLALHYSARYPDKVEKIL